jgi:hypothetical protein
MQLNGWSYDEVQMHVSLYLKKKERYVVLVLSLSSSLYVARLQSQVLLAYVLPLHAKMNLSQILIIAAHMYNYET